MEVNNMYNMDCLLGLKGIKDGFIDTVICDPPYGIDYQSGWRNKDARFNKIQNDKKPFIEPLKMLPRILKDTGCIYLFTRWDVQQVFIDELTRIGIPAKSVIIWDKGNHSMGDLKREYGRRYESIIFAPCKNFTFKNGRGVDIIDCARIPAEKLCHPNEKPVPLIQKLIRDSTPPPRCRFRLYSRKRNYGGCRD